MRLNWTYRETWLHRVNPSLKLLCAVAVFLFVLFQHNINVLFNATFVPLSLFVFFTGHPWKRLLLLSVPVAVLVVSSMSSMMFYGLGDTTWFRWGLVHITEESFYRGLHIGLKSLNFALIGLLFALTTRPVDLFYSLMQQCRLPAKYAYSFMAAMRLIPIMLEEFQTLRHARIVRGGGRRRVSVYGTLKAYAVPLLAQSIRRAQRIAVAMEAKRFTRVKTRTYYYEPGFSAADAVFVLVGAAALYAAYRAGWALPYVPVTDVRYGA